MNACDHIRWNAVDPEEALRWVDGGHSIVGGEDTVKTISDIYWRCPICHTECYPPKSEQKEWTDE